MTVEADINALNTTVTNLDTEITVDKALLDGLEADADALKNDAASLTTAASGYVTEASTLKTAAQAYSTSIGSASPIIDLSALDESKADTIFDIFVYDTSKDSDGGAWRYKTQGAAWYNEASGSYRGTRKEFPAIAVIVSHTNGDVVIYDGDDRSLPMWMKIFVNDRENISLAALNGKVCLANDRSNTHPAHGGNGLLIYDFAGDRVYTAWANGSNPHYYPPLSSKLVSGSFTNMFSGVGIAGTHDKRYYEIGNYVTNGVAMTVLPDAPIDSVTGLPNPTIALATDGGLKVIMNDHSVVASASTTGTHHVAFCGSKVVTAHLQAPQSAMIYNLEAITNGVVDWEGAIRREDKSNSIWPQAGVGMGTNTRYVSIDDNEFAITSSWSMAQNAFATNDGVWRVRLSDWPHKYRNVGMICKTNELFTTGWMVGDIRFAGLASCSPTALIESNNLVINGDFEDGLTGWSEATGYPIVTSVTNGVVQIEHGTAPATGYPSIYQSLPTQLGAFYVAEAEQVAKNTGFLLFVKSDSSTWSSPNQEYLSVWSGIGATKGGFYATSTASHLHLTVNSYGTGNWIQIDNVSVKQADPDVGWRENHLNIKGKITRSPVAEGAELMGYSGFSAGNYLQMPYTSDFDFGLDNFSYMIWIKTVDTYGNIVFWSDADGLRRNALITTAGNIYFSTYDGSASSVSGPNIMTNEWTHVVATRHGGSSGLMELYVNGELAASATNPVSNSSSADQSAKVWVGIDRLEGNPINASLALLRISGTIPTAEQIRKIYEDERVLFQPGAKCRLQGNYGGIKEAAYDSSTGLLYTGSQNGGTQIFDGLRMVKHTSDNVSAAISAAKGVVVRA